MKYEELITFIHFKNGNISEKTTESGIELYSMDAAWFDVVAKPLYLFKDNNWFAFSLGYRRFMDVFQSKGLTYQLNGTLAEIGIDANVIDSVATIGITGFLFENGWFYEVNSDPFRSKNEKVKHLSLTDFFNIEVECYEKKSNEFRQLVNRYTNWKHRSTSTGRKVSRNNITTPMKQTLFADATDGRRRAIPWLYVTLISVIVIGLVTVIALMIVWGHYGELK